MYILPKEFITNELQFINLVTVFLKAIITCYDDQLANYYQNILDLGSMLKEKKSFLGTVQKYQKNDCNGTECQFLLGQYNKLSDDIDNAEYIIKTRLDKQYESLKNPKLYEDPYYD